MGFKTCVFVVSQSVNSFVYKQITNKTTFLVTLIECFDPRQIPNVSTWNSKNSKKNWRFKSSQLTANGGQLNSRSSYFESVTFQALALGVVGFEFTRLKYGSSSSTYWLKDYDEKCAQNNKFVVSSYHGAAQSSLKRQLEFTKTKQQIAHARCPHSPPAAAIDALTAYLQLLPERRALEKTHRSSDFNEKAKISSMLARKWTIFPK